MFSASLSHVCFSPRAAEKLDMAGYSISADCVVKVAGLRFFRENTKREVIADPYNLNRVTEVACEFYARR